MKKMMLAAVASSVFASGFALAQQAPAPEAKKPDHEVSFNLGIASEYRYRGLSQSRSEPALQGGADYTYNPSGLYAGTWLSTIKWIKDAGTIGGYNGKGDVEIDVYGGKKGDIGGGFSYDVGGLYYWFPNNNYGQTGRNANTFELYAKVGYGPAYLKYSHSLTNLFGWIDSKNSGYLDAGADLDLGSGYTLNLHVGHQRTKNNPIGNYTDYKIGVSKEFFGVGFSLAAIGTDADKTVYVAPSGKFLGKNGVVLTASKTF